MGAMPDVPASDDESTVISGVPRVRAVPAPAPTTDEAEAPRSGEVRFVDASARARLGGALEASRLLVVDVDGVGPGLVGRLGEHVDERIERALSTRGAAAPGIGACADRDASLSDQLYRARRIGRAGLALFVGALDALVDEKSALHPNDAATLRFLADAARERPLVLLLSASNAALRAYAEPQPLGEVLRIAAPRLVTPPAPTPAMPHATAKLVGPATKPPHAEPRVASATGEPPKVTARTPAPISTASLLSCIGALKEIDRATPLSALERAFVTAYSPLRAALLADQLGGTGLAKADLRALLAQFGALLSRAYVEAMPTFASTGRRPKLVLDLFEIAQRCARVHGARSTTVVIVDALRWDLGVLVRERMAEHLASAAICVEEQPLWSMLPTTTAVALDALTRGEDALRAPAAVATRSAEAEGAVVRGRALEVLRRLRLGHRDVLKLDLLEARLRDGGDGERARLHAHADELSRVLARAVGAATSRTLVVIAGDHGFRLDESEGLTGPAKQGGTSPEELIVPMHAWLVGGVH
jgi:hypothetical protein